jgi:hypothetical protein
MVTPAKTCAPHPQIPKRHAPLLLESAGVTLRLVVVIVVVITVTSSVVRVSIRLIPRQLQREGHCVHL